MWLAHHNPKTHRKLCPTLDGARAIFESAELARVEAIGALQLVGVGANLEAALNQRYEGQLIEAPGSADEAGIAEVIRLLLREDLTGAAPPQNLSMVLDLWRPWVKSRAGDLMRELTANLEDQEKFAQLARQLIGALESDLGDSSSNNDDQSDSDSDQDRGNDKQSDQESEQSAVSDDNSDGGDDSQTIDDAGNADIAEDGDVVEVDGSEDGMSDGDSPTQTCKATIRIKKPL